MQTNSHTLNDGAAIVRTTGTVWDAALCRVAQTTIEPGSATLQLTTTYGYDAFGNVATETVSGVGVPSRTTTVNWGTSGRFPTTVTNALSQTTVNTWNAALAVPSGTTDPNGLTTSWQYDAFGRRTKETRPDTTYTTWTLSANGPGCDPRARSYVLETPYTTGGSPIAYNYVFLDRFDRPVNEYRWSFAGGSYDTVIRNYDALGRLSSEGMPYISGGCGSYSSPYATSYQYDVLNRLTQVSRPLSDSVPTLQTTNIYHEGLTTRTVDPLGKQATRTMSVTGRLVRSTDHSGYYQHFDYDAFANPVRVTDSLGNTLQSNVFNARGMRTAHTDMDAGARSFVPNALGEVTSQTDAKSQTATFVFDLLGRMTSRTEPEGTSTWTWGASAAARNIGRLQSLSGSGYSESYVYDTYGRLQTRNITSDTSYAFDYSYNTQGTLDTLTYPVSTTGNRFKLQYSYQNGRLWKVGNFASPYTTFWQANNVDAQGHVIDESFGNGLQNIRGYDQVTGLIDYVLSGPGANGTIQNLTYEWDAVGSLSRRIDVRQGLTEAFYYDPLHRLDYSTLNGSTNLDLTYDAMGNLTYKSDVGTYTYHATKKHAVASTAGALTTWYTYDANGNIALRNGLTQLWYSYDLPKKIVYSGAYSEFWYTQNRRRSR